MRVSYVSCSLLRQPNHKLVEIQCMTVIVSASVTFDLHNSILSSFKMAESETMSIDTSNEAQDDPLQDLSFDKLEEFVENTL